MSQIFWSDKLITLNITNKAINTTGISNVTITGTGGITCANSLTSEANGTQGISNTNYDKDNWDKTSQITFYGSVANLQDTEGEGNVTVIVKWCGPDYKPNTGDETFSDIHTVENVIIRNAIDSIVIGEERYEFDYGDDILIDYNIYGENHNGSFLPIYNTNGLNTTLLDSENNVVNVNIFGEYECTLHENNIVSNIAEISQLSEGSYIFKIQSCQGVHGEHSVSATTNIVIIIPLLQLDIKRLDYAKLG